MKLEDLLQEDLSGKVWFMPTDTIPGLSALFADDVGKERIYNIKGRDKHKPLLSLCANTDLIGVVLGRGLTDTEHELVLKVSTTPTSIIIIEGRTFRLINESTLKSFLTDVGPIYSTSCNRSGAPTITIAEYAQIEFGDEIDFYVTEKLEATGQPSSIIKIIR